MGCFPCYIYNIFILIHAYVVCIYVYFWDISHYRICTHTRVWIDNHIPINGHFRNLDRRYLPYIRPTLRPWFQLISPQNIAWHMVQYLHFRILKLPLISSEVRSKLLDHHPNYENKKCSKPPTRYGLITTYPLVNVYITNWKITMLSMGKSTN